MPSRIQWLESFRLQRASRVVVVSTMLSDIGPRCEWVAALSIRSAVVASDYLLDCRQIPTVKCRRPVSVASTNSPGPRFQQILFELAPWLANRQRGSCLHSFAYPFLPPVDQQAAHSTRTLHLCSASRDLRLVVHSHPSQKFPLSTIFLPSLAPQSLATSASSTDRLQERERVVDTCVSLPFSKPGFIPFIAFIFTIRYPRLSTLRKYSLTFPTYHTQWP